jgi:hypothetical protein
MIWSLSCSDPSGLPSVDGGGAVVCTVGVPSMVAVDAGLGALTVAEMETLMGYALGVVVMAWGFKMLGRMLFRGA